MMQLTAHMLREAFRQTQREILAMQTDHQVRWERFAELLNARLKTEAAEQVSKQNRCGGVCPCCNRSFVQLQRHMKTKHPEYPQETPETGE